MVRKFLAISLICLLLDLTCASLVLAQNSKSQTDNAAKHDNKIKRLVQNAGLGRDANIEVKLRDKSELMGFVSGVADDHFVITDETTAVATSLSYDQVDKVKIWPLVKNEAHREFSSPAGVIKKFAIGGAIGFTLLAVGCLIIRKCVD